MQVVQDITPPIAQRATLSEIFALSAAPKSRALLTGPDGVGEVGFWRLSAALGWVPEGRINLRVADENTFAGLITDHIGGGSTFTWTSGIAVTDETRLSLQLWESSIARDDIAELSAKALWEGVTLSGSLGASSRPRWLAGARGANRIMVAGVAYDGSFWEAGNEYGAVGSPTLQSAITVPGFATGIKFSTEQMLVPRQTDTNTGYVVLSGVGAASGECAAWDGSTAETIVADPPYTAAHIVCLDTHTSTTPGGTLTELCVCIMER